MPVFEHVMTLMSFIVSLGLAMLMTFAARLAQAGRRVTVSIPWVLWLAVIFLTQIAFWLFAYQSRAVANLPPLTFAMVLGMACACFLQCALLTPTQGERDDGQELDLALRHARHRAGYIGAVIAFDLLGIGHSSYEAWRGAVAEAIAPATIAAILASDVMAIAAIAWPARWLQLAAPAVHLALAFASIGLALAAMNA